MSTRNQRFNARMRSFDAMTSGMPDISKAAVFSDRGEGVERMADELDRTPESESLAERDAVSSRFRKMDAARTRLRRVGDGISNFVDDATGRANAKPVLFYAFSSQTKSIGPKRSD